jgi:glycosyltransferase involved in cell wall biosynthesis
MKKDKFMFSVIIPTLNEEKYLPLLLNDLTKQNNPFFETIVVDGDSTDNTIKEAVKFKSKLNLSIIKGNNKGVAAQRNYGSRNSKGEYLVFFDADVRIPKNFLSTLSKEMLLNKGLIYTTHLSTNSKSSTQALLVELTNFIIDTFNLLGKPFAPGFNIIIEKNLFIKLGGFDIKLKLAEDHDLVQRSRKMGVLLKILKEPHLYPSFRRPEKIGYLKFLIQYVISGAYTALGEPIKKELYEYEMGGHLYQEKTTKLDSGDKNKAITSSFITVKNHLKKLTKHIELPF